MREPVPTTLTNPLKWLLWIGAITVGGLLFYYDFRQLDGIRLADARLIVGRDFFNVWSGGNLAISSQLDTLYNYKAYMQWQENLFGPLDPYNYSYPPQSLFLAIPFASLPYIMALTAWTFAGAAFFIWAARPYMPENLSPLLAAATPAAIVNIWAGHYGFVVGGLWLLFFDATVQAPRRSGIFAGLLTIKPHLGLLIALTLLHRRMFGAILVALAVTATCVVLSGWVFGFDLWHQWIFDTSALQTRIMTAPGKKFYYLMMPSTFITLRDAPQLVAIAGQICVAGLALFFVWKARNVDNRSLAFITATATAVISPYIFNYDLTVASLGFAVLLYGRWDALEGWERIMVWVAFASPLLVMISAPLAPLSLLVGLFVQVRHATQAKDYSALGLSPAAWGGAKRVFS